MKVLMVDDEEDIRKVGRLSLESVGHFTTAVAASAEEGLGVAESFQPDVILMDMMMPGMDGLEALASILSNDRLRHIPVVIMTAKVQRAEIALYLQRGAIGVIQKPFDPLTLPDQLRELLAAR